METDDEYEEQEVLVYVDFNSKVDDDLISIENEFKFIGLESDQPVLQLGNQVFQGEWKDSMGTQVIFEPDPNPPKSDPLFNETPIAHVRYACQTEKILHMSRIFVNSKSETNEKETVPAQETNQVEGGD